MSDSRNENDKVEMLSESAGSVTLPFVLEPGFISIGTVSWLRDIQKRQPWDYLSTAEFLKSLQAIGTLDTKVDLILCAGKTIDGNLSPKTVLSYKTIQNVVSGQAVVYETDSSCWHISYSKADLPKYAILRRGQLVYTAGSNSDKYMSLNDIFVSEGVISYEDTGIKLALFICGENNAFKYSPGGPVLKYIDSDRINDLFKKDWIALNPSHFPYGAPVTVTGHGKVSKVKNGEAGPTLGKFVIKKKGRGSGQSIPPHAVVHVNNYLVNNALSKDVSSVVFTKEFLGSDQKMSPLSEYNFNVGQKDEFRYVIYKIKLPKGALTENH